MAINRRKPEWKKIKPFDGIEIFYGFGSKCSSGDQNTLGHVDIAPSTDYTKLVIYPNNCKPHTATKKGSTGSNSGYIDVGKIAAAQQAGWKIKWGYPPRRRRAKGQNKSIKIGIGTVKYGYIRASDTLNDMLNTFGHGTPDGNDILWYGCQFPRPPRVARQNASGQSVSSYCDPTKVDDNIQAGGTLTNPGSYTAIHLANMIVAAPAPEPAP